MVLYFPMPQVVFWTVRETGEQPPVPSLWLVKWETLSTNSAVSLHSLSRTEQTAELCHVSEPNLSHWLYLWADTRESGAHIGHSRRIPLGYMPHGEPSKCWENGSALSDCKEEVPPGMYLSYIAAMLWPIPASGRPVCSRVHQGWSVLDVQ